MHHSNPMMWQQQQQQQQLMQSQAQAQAQAQAQQAAIEKMKQAQAAQQQAHAQAQAAQAQGQMMPQHQQINPMMTHMNPNMNGMMPQMMNMMNPLQMQMQMQNLQAMNMMGMNPMLMNQMNMNLINPMSYPSPPSDERTLTMNSDFQMDPNYEHPFLSRVSCACSNCKRAKTRCDDERPCGRCRRLGREATCVDSVHQRRGRKQKKGDTGDAEEESETSSSAKASPATGARLLPVKEKSSLNPAANTTSSTDVPPQLPQLAQLAAAAAAQSNDMTDVEKSEAATPSIDRSVSYSGEQRTSNQPTPLNNSTSNSKVSSAVDSTTPPRPTMGRIGSAPTTGTVSTPVAGKQVLTAKRPGAKVSPNVSRAGTAPSPTSATSTLTPPSMPMRMGIPPNGAMFSMNVGSVDPQALAAQQQFLQMQQMSMFPPQQSMPMNSIGMTPSLSPSSYPSPSPYQPATQPSPYQPMMNSPYTMPMPTTMNAFTMNPAMAMQSPMNPMMNPMMFNMMPPTSSTAAAAAAAGPMQPVPTSAAVGTGSAAAMHSSPSLTSTSGFRTLSNES